MKQPTPLIPGDMAPVFALPDLLHGTWFSYTPEKAQTIITVFWSAECHWCQHLAAYFPQRQAEWEAHGAHLLLLASNRTETDAQLIEKAQAIGYTGRLLRDKDNSVANAFGAMSTPHAFVIDGGHVVYQGGVNDRTFHTEPTVNYLDLTVERVLSGAKPDPSVTKAYGCAIVRQSAL